MLTMEGKIDVRSKLSLQNCLLSHVKTVLPFTWVKVQARSFYSHGSIMSSLHSSGVERKVEG
jgi:hypothetical protein